MTSQTEVEQSVTAAGLRLHVTLAGSGAARPVLILHGFTGSAQSMAGVASEFNADRQTIRLDFVGHGRSEAPSDPFQYGMDRCVDQVLALVDGLCARPPHLLGYSMGGRVALCAATRSPHAFASLLLVGASAGLAGVQARTDRIRADEALADRIESRGLEEFVESWLNLPLFESLSRLGAEALDRAREQRLRNSPHALANSLRGMGTGAQLPVHEHLGRISPPVCLVAGAEDEKFKTIALDLASTLPRAETHWIPEAGHAAHLENPAAFGHVARTFFDQVDREIGAVARKREA